MLDSRWVRHHHYLISAFMFSGSCFIHLKIGGICWHAKMCQRRMWVRPSSFWHQGRARKYLGEHNSKPQVKKEKKKEDGTSLSQTAGCQTVLTSSTTPKLARPVFAVVPWPTPYVGSRKPRPGRFAWPSSNRFVSKLVLNLLLAWETWRTRFELVYY